MNLEWKKISEESLKAGYRKYLKRIFLMPDGRTEVYDVKDEGKVCCVLALTKKNEVVIAKQYRPGPEKVLFELPGGLVDTGETPEEAIKRELLEETGYTGNIEFVGTSLRCAYSTGIRYHFIARDCEKIQEPQLEENEFIEVELMPIEEFRKHLSSGNLSDVATGYMGLEYLGLL